MKSALAAQVGNNCPGGACTASDIVITGITAIRRAGIRVDFYIKVASASKAAAGASTLGTFLSKPASLDAFTKTLKASGGAFANIQKVEVKDAPKATWVKKPTVISGTSRATAVTSMAGLALLCMALRN